MGFIKEKYSLKSYQSRSSEFVKANRKVVLALPTGCLTYENEVEVDITSKIDCKIISNNIEEIGNYLDTISGNFYIYIYFDKYLNPKYIGKGKYHRVLSHLYDTHNASLKAFILEKNFYIGIESLYKPQDERKAYIREHNLLKSLGLDNLFNKNLGEPNKLSFCESLHTNTTIVEYAKSIHGDLYDYSKSVYRGFNNKMEIICPKNNHGSFWQKPSNHITLSQGCPKCKGGVAKDKGHYQGLVNRYLEIQKDQTLLTKIDSNIRHNSSLSFLCNTCGVIHKKYFSHLSENKGCSSCNNNGLGNYFYPFHLIVEEITNRTINHLGKMHSTIHTGLKAFRRYKRTGYLTLTCNHCGVHYSKPWKECANNHNGYCTKIIRNSDDNARSMF